MNPKRWLWLLCGMILAAAGNAEIQALPTCQPTSCQLLPETHASPAPAQPTAPPPPTLETRAALDIGSGATKMKIALVDAKTNKIAKRLFEQVISMPYEKALANSSNDEFDRATIEQGIQTINTLKALAAKYGAKKVAAVATAAFRRAKNAQTVAKEIKAKTGIEVNIISQQQEAEYDFLGAVANCPAMAEHAVVWDVGGGSAQLTTMDENNQLVIYKSLFASVPFKNYIIEKIQGKKLSETNTPNPMTAADIQKAVDYAAVIALQTDPYIKQKITAKDTVVLGVGGILYKEIGSLEKETENNDQILTKNELARMIASFIGKDDAVIEKEFNLSVSNAESYVSNLLLIQGYMQALKIEEVTLLNVNNADAVMTIPSYWKN